MTASASSPLTSWPVRSWLLLGLPVGLVVLVGLYWGLLLRRRSTGARSGKVE